VIIISTNRSRRRVRVILVLSFLVMLLLTLLLTGRHLQSRSATAAGVLAFVRQDLRESASSIDVAFARAQALGDLLATDLASGALPYADSCTRLRAELAAASDVNGLAITFEPYAYDPSLRLYQCYVFRTPSGAIDELRGATYDYTRPPVDDPGAPQTAWYYNTIRTGANWSAPFLATGAGKVLIEYARPFLHRDGQQTPAGVVTADLSLQEVRALLSRLDLGTQGYGFVIGRDGTFLDYPDRTLVARSSIFDPESGFDPEVQAAARRALAGETVELRNLDALSERDAWFFFAPLPTSGSAIVLVVDASDLQPPAEQILRELMGIALAAAASLVLGLALWSSVRQQSASAAWGVAIGFTLSCLALIGLTWYLDARLARAVDGALTTRAGVERALELYLREAGSDAVYAVPTGVQLTAVQFPDAASVTVGGFVWQFYSDSIPKEVSRGFSLTRELGELMVVEEVARTSRSDGELIIWRMNTTLQQSWDPAKFPFDERMVQLDIVPAELIEHVILVPDLSGYQLLRPSALPGIDAAVTINNWRFQRSFFRFVAADANSSLGLASRAERSAPPVLQFALLARRHVVGPFIAYVLPGVVALALIFAFLLTDRQIRDSQDLVAALSYTAALFFVIALVHTTLRDSVAAVGITYLEHLYLLLYIVVLLVTVIAFLLVHIPGLVFISYQSNLLPKLLFWPLCTGALLVSTLVIFVYGGS